MNDLTTLTPAGLDAGHRSQNQSPGVQTATAREVHSRATQGVGLLTPGTRASSVRSRPALRMLVADDNADAARSLAMLLSLEGHEVHVAGDGLQAVTVAAQIRPQVAVLDIGMPQLDGHEVARRLRRGAGGHEMLLLAVTGWGKQEDQRRASAAGFDRHFTKPVDPTELIDCIDAWRAVLGLR